MLQTLPPEKQSRSPQRGISHASTPRGELRQRLNRPPTENIPAWLTQEPPRSPGQPWVPGLPASRRPHGGPRSTHRDWGLTSKVGQPPNPRNWHLPLASPLTELEGEKKETSGDQ